MSAYVTCFTFFRDPSNITFPTTGPTYQNDNALVYRKLEEASRGTSLEPAIKFYSRRKDGRGA